MGPALCFNHWAHHQPKQILKYYLSHRRFTHCVPVATQRARLARWWKDQACRWTDRISRGASLCENWASLRLTLIVEGESITEDFFSLTWATISGGYDRLKSLPTMSNELRSESFCAHKKFITSDFEHKCVEINIIWHIKMTIKATERTFLEKDL